MDSLWCMTDASNNFGYEICDPMGEKDKSVQALCYNLKTSEACNTAAGCYWSTVFEECVGTIPARPPTGLAAQKSCPSAFPYLLKYDQAWYCYELANGNEGIGSL